MYLYQFALVCGNCTYYQTTHATRNHTHTFIVLSKLALTTVVLNKSLQRLLTVCPCFSNLCTTASSRQSHTTKQFPSCELPTTPREPKKHVVGVLKSSFVAASEASVSGSGSKRGWTGEEQGGSEYRASTDRVRELKHSSARVHGRRTRVHGHRTRSQVPNVFTRFARALPSLVTPPPTYLRTS